MDPFCCPTNGLEECGEVYGFRLEHVEILQKCMDFAWSTSRFFGNESPCEV